MYHVLQNVDFEVDYLFLILTLVNKWDDATGIEWNIRFQYDWLNPNTRADFSLVTEGFVL